MFTKISQLTRDGEMGLGWQKQNKKPSHNPKTRQTQSIQEGVSNTHNHQVVAGTSPPFGKPHALQQGMLLATPTRHTNHLAGKSLCMQLLLKDITHPTLPSPMFLSCRCTMLADCASVAKPVLRTGQKAKIARDTDMC